MLMNYTFYISIKNIVYLMLLFWAKNMSEMAFGEPKRRALTKLLMCSCWLMLWFPYQDYTLLQPQLRRLWEVVLVKRRYLKRQLEYLIAYSEVLGWAGHLETKSIGMHLEGIVNTVGVIPNYWDTALSSAPSPDTIIYRNNYYAAFTFGMHTVL